MADRCDQKKMALPEDVQVLEAINKLKMEQQVQVVLVLETCGKEAIVGTQPKLSDEDSTEEHLETEKDSLDVAPLASEDGMESDDDIEAKIIEQAMELQRAAHPLRKPTHYWPGQRATPARSLRLP